MIRKKCRQQLIRCWILFILPLCMLSAFLVSPRESRRNLVLKRVQYMEQDSDNGHTVHSLGQNVSGLVQSSSYLQGGHSDVVQSLSNLQGRHSDFVQSSSNLQGGHSDVVQSLSNLPGRHSDFVLDEPCQDPEHKYNWAPSRSYDFVGPFNYLPEFKNPCFREPRGKLRCLPYFYLIGAPKAGSTDIYLKIARHPQVASGRNKEPRWFDRRRYGESLQTLRISSFYSYMNVYNLATAVISETSSTLNGERYYDKITGDGSITYYFSSYYWKNMTGNEGCSEPRVTAISHIHHLWPKAKLILTLRDPVIRLYSSYHFNLPHTRGRGTPEEFHEWVLEAMQVWNNCLEAHSFRYCMYDTTLNWNPKLFEFHIGLYSRYVLDILRLFPRDQLLVVPMEDYSARNKFWMSRIFEFLELDALSEAELQGMEDMKVGNKNKRKERQRPILPETLKLLHEFYGPFNRELADILGDNRFLWFS